MRMILIVKNGKPVMMAPIDVQQKKDTVLPRMSVGLGRIVIHPHIPVRQEMACAILRKTAKNGRYAIL